MADDHEIMLAACANLRREMRSPSPTPPPPGRPPLSQGREEDQLDLYYVAQRVVGSMELARRDFVHLCQRLPANERVENHLPRDTVAAIEKGITQQLICPRAEVFLRQLAEGPWRISPAQLGASYGNEVFQAEFAERLVAAMNQGDSWESVHAKLHQSKQHLKATGQVKKHPEKAGTTLVHNGLRKKSRTNTGGGASAYDSFTRFLEEV